MTDEQLHRDAKIGRLIQQARHEIDTAVLRAMCDAERQARAAVGDDFDVEQWDAAVADLYVACMAERAKALALVVDQLLGSVE